MFSFLLFSILVCNINLYELKEFDDTVLYNINWPGSLDNYETLSGKEYMIVRSVHDEMYKCFLPNVSEKEDTISEKYDGLSALEMLKPLFNPKLPCTHRLDIYWTYEVCHGRHIRQYHEERDSKLVKIQEYILGKWDESLFESMLEKSKLDDVNRSQSVPTKKIEGNNLPYLEIPMGNGTLCDLNHNKPRQTNLIYVCYIHSKHDIYSIKETTTCQYEIVILSPLLCGHPRYKPQDTDTNDISCVPMENTQTPKKPYNLVKMKRDGNKFRRNPDLEQLRVGFMSDLADKDTNDDDTKRGTIGSPAKDRQPMDTSPVESLLSGVHCLHGGTGWWRYEFCYGKHVQQYHMEKDGSKTVITLGVFDKEAHLDWLMKHPHKRPKALAQRTQLSHFYSGGSVCDKTDRPRQTEVKLKCLENASATVSLYLLEPRYCEYILGVESPLICDILKRADDNALVEQEGASSPTTFQKDATFTANIIQL